MEKRVRFKSAWLPWALIAPQMAVVLVFFFWPAGQALYQSVLSQDAFGGSVQLLQNHRILFHLGGRNRFISVFVVSCHG
jgi:sn-glycerol 3-phosphate transport system permease protein